MNKAEREAWERRATSTFDPRILGNLYRQGTPQRDSIGRYTATQDQILAALRRAHQPPEHRKR